MSIPTTSGIYRITCTVTGKFYIGSAINLRRRHDNHFFHLQRNDHENPKLQNAWNKYGAESFTFEVLELVLPMSLTAREQHWFNKLKPFGNKGFNIMKVAGSSMGRVVSPETRKKIADGQRGRSNPHPGYEVSPETRAKMSKSAMGNRSNLGRKLPPEHCAKIVQNKTYIVVAPDGTEYHVHGLKKFCQEHALNYESLIKVANGRHKTSKGWQARFPDAT